ncbi:hypothetical protein BIWAKO_03406 [Bosea sp. BIWAKO-01]|nr:hypothetical protein BIWAKO_03406 [Bosea sp. BIWAKO-01]
MRLGTLRISGKSVRLNGVGAKEIGHFVYDSELKTVQRHGTRSLKSS